GSELPASNAPGYRKRIVTCSMLRRRLPHAPPELTPQGRRASKLMNRHTTNALIVCVALLAHLGLSFRSGSTSVENGLGPDGSIYAARVVEGNAQRGTAVHRLTPAFTRAASVAYAVTGNIKSSFELVNLAAFSVLCWAACIILDAYAVPLSVKACAALTLAVLGLPVSTTAFAS